MDDAPVPKRLPTFERINEPPQMRFTERDGRILETIDRFDGLLADYQIAHLFFAGVSPRTVRDRLKLLYQNGYINRPTRRQRAGLPCMVYWLGEKGAEYVAGLRGEVADIAKLTKPPRWALVEHDLAINDVRIAIHKACEQAGAVLEEWVSSREFWAYPDTVRYSTSDDRIESRLVRPDGYGVVLYQGQVRSRLLLEMDRATEDNPRFVREKVIPGLAYIRSEAYRARFGANTGRWIVVTVSAQRAANMKRQAEIAAGQDAKAFYFTTLKQVQASNILTAPIWSRPGYSRAGALFGEQAFLSS